MIALPDLETLKRQTIYPTTEEIMSFIDRIVLLLTGLAAIYLLWQFVLRFRHTHRRHNLYYSIAFGVLLVAGLLLIAFTYSALASPLVVVVAVLIPTGLALGLISEFFPAYEQAFALFAGIGLAAIAVTRFAGPEWLATVTLVIVHAVSGLVILALPVWAVSQKETPIRFIWVSVGGLLIDAGGMALAFLKAGSQLLFFSETVVFAVLAPLLLLMALSFARGFTCQPAHSV
jgi:hypothetical protein